MDKGYEDPGNAACGNPQDEFNYIVGIITQTFLLLIISQLFHLALKNLGQPSAISQLLAGVVMGRSGIASIPVVGPFVFPDRNMDYFSSTAAIGRMFYMFLVGLEIDIPQFLRGGRKAAAIAGGGAVVCLIVGGALSPLVYWQTKAYGSRVLFAFTLMLVFTDTASPILVRMATELKLSTSDFGRLAVCASVINDIASLVLVAFVTSSPGRDFSFWQELGLGIGTVALLGGSAYMARPAIRWLNRRNRQRKHIKNTEVVSLLLFVIGVSSLTEMMGYNSMMSSFLLGLVFPREGSTTRTLVNKLTYPVNNLLLPVYIGYAGAQTNMMVMRNWRFVGAVLTVVSLGTMAKVGGTVAAARYLGMPVQEGVALGFLLNVKGHVDLIILGLARKHRISGADAFMVLLVAVVMSTLMAGPTIALLVRKQRKDQMYTTTGLEYQAPEAELRILACVHGPRDAPPVLNLIEMTTATDQTPVSVYVMHLVELPAKTNASLLYHQQEEVEDGDDDDYGGDHARQINVTCDAFMAETRIRIRQSTAVAAMKKIPEEICRRAKDVRASVVVVPFHKFQRVDGKMVGGKEGIRTSNVNVLRHAPCTVGVLVDRGLGGVTQAAAAEGSRHIAVLFFGGADDREAMALGGRLAINSSVSLTVVRFLPATARRDGEGIKVEASRDHDEVLMAIAKDENEDDRDDAFLSNFYNRFVVSGMVKYEERFIENEQETVEAINAMAGMYSLFLVGRGQLGAPPLTGGRRQRDECPELGAVGDLLASSTSTITASVLILQQHDKSTGGNAESTMAAS